MSDPEEKPENETAKRIGRFIGLLGFLLICCAIGGFMFKLGWKMALWGWGLLP